MYSKLLLLITYTKNKDRRSSKCQVRIFFCKYKLVSLWRYMQRFCVFSLGTKLVCLTHFYRWCMWTIKWLALSENTNPSNKRPNFLNNKLFFFNHPLLAVTDRIHRYAWLLAEAVWKKWEKGLYDLYGFAKWFFSVWASCKAHNKPRFINVGNVIAVEKFISSLTRNFEPFVCEMRCLLKVLF